MDNLKVHAANGGRLDSLGKLEAQLSIETTSCASTLHVLRGLQTPLFSKQSCINLGLLESGWPQSRLSQIRKLSLPKGLHAADVGTAAQTGRQEHRIQPRSDSADLEQIKLSLSWRSSLRSSRMNHSKPCKALPCILTYRITQYHAATSAHGRFPFTGGNLWKNSSKA